MQNKCNCGCDQGFVPVNSNWDFSTKGNCDCNNGSSNRSMRRRSTNGCQCERRDDNREMECCEQNDYKGQSESDCQCERCDDNREVECCEQNTYIRDMDGCEKGESACHRSHSGCTGRDDCQCETCTRNRNRRCNNDCDACNGNNACRHNRSGNCGCESDNASTYARSRKNCKVGMINVEMQDLDEIFASESALRAGTLFPELHKPMNGYCPYDGNCGTCKQAAAFAAWEMRLYLNTHPNEKEALALFRKLCNEAEEPNYATSFLTDECKSNWDWVKNPWPWEYDCHCGD